MLEPIRDLTNQPPFSPVFWDGKPFHPISHFYKKQFGEKIRRIPVSIATDCPNRRGLRGMETCIFCDVWGSAAYPELQGESLKSQIEQKKVVLGERYSTSGFLVYFQSYTNTFLGTAKLRESFNTALSFPEVKGIIIGTRPDCLSPSVFELWREFSQKTFVSVELGVQSFYNDQLEFLKRGHTGEASIKAIEKIKKETNVDLGIHLIFGIPGETEETVIETAHIISKLPVDNVKLHNLHVLKNTGLEKLYNEGKFTPVTIENYARSVALFLQHTSPHIPIQRLSALSSHWEELVAPEWSKHKMRSAQFIIEHMQGRGMYQGQKYSKSL